MLCLANCIYVMLIQVVFMLCLFNCTYVYPIIFMLCFSNCTCMLFLSDNSYINLYYFYKVTLVLCLSNCIYALFIQLRKCYVYTTKILFSLKLIIKAQFIKLSYLFLCHCTMYIGSL